MISQLYSQHIKGWYIHQTNISRSIMTPQFHGVLRHFLSLSSRWINNIWVHFCDWCRPVRTFCFWMKCHSCIVQVLWALPLWIRELSVSQLSEKLLTLTDKECEGQKMKHFTSSCCRFFPSVWTAAKVQTIYEVGWIIMLKMLLLKNF